ncbi:MAG TPA: diiron oxygenase [Gammaproteobacteria bacterium]
MSLWSVKSTEILEQLNQHRIYQDPVNRVNWLRLNLDDYWLPEEALSLYGVSEFMVLPAAQRKALSHFEYLHLLEAQVWLEGLFMERLSQSASYARKNIALLKYHLNELREEAGHSLVFAEIIQRSGLPRVATRFQDLGWMNWFTRHSSVDSVTFWLTIMLGQEIPDRLNRVIRQHKNTVCPAIFDVATFHTVDEVRHISFSRRMVDAGVQELSPGKAFVVSFILQRMLNQFVAAYFYPEPGLYDFAGLVPGRSWASLARKNPHRKQFIRQHLAGVLHNLHQAGVPLIWRSK